MKEYYEKKVKQAEMVRKFIVEGTKRELERFSLMVDTNIKPEDLTFYAEMIERADSDLQLARECLSDWLKGVKNA